MVEPFGECLLELAAVYEMSGHALGRAQDLAAFMFHQAEGLRLVASSILPAESLFMVPVMRTYTNSSKSYLHNVVEGGRSKRQPRNHGFIRA